MGFPIITDVELRREFSEEQARRALELREAIRLQELQYEKTRKRAAEPSKCPSCGSHQFVMHANRRICSYCRSEG